MYVNKRNDKSLGLEIRMGIIPSFTLRLLPPFVIFDQTNCATTTTGEELKSYSQRSVKYCPVNTFLVFVYIWRCRSLSTTYLTMHWKTVHYKVLQVKRLCLNNTRFCDQILDTKSRQDWPKEWLCFEFVQLVKWSSLSKSCFTSLAPL